MAIVVEDSAARARMRGRTAPAPVVIGALLLGLIGPPAALQMWPIEVRRPGFFLSAQGYCRTWQWPERLIWAGAGRMGCTSEHGVYLRLGGLVWLMIWRSQWPANL